MKYKEGSYIIRMCLHQVPFMRSKHFWEKEGYGNCTICEPDEANKLCKGYYPITMVTGKFNDMIVEK